MVTEKTFEEKNLEFAEEQKLRLVIQRQIAGVIDVQRSREVWRNLLRDFPADLIAEVLSSELTHFNYREVQRTTCGPGCYR